MRRQEKTISGSSEARIALLNLGIGSEKIKALRNYYQEGVGIDYPEFPVTLAFIFSFLEKKGLEVEIFDWALYKWLNGEKKSTKEFLSRLKEFAPNLILILSKGYNLKEVERTVSVYGSKDSQSFPKFMLLSYAAGVNVIKTLRRIGKNVPLMTYGEIEPFIKFIIENAKKMTLEEFWNNAKIAPNVAYLDKDGRVTINALTYTDLNELPFPEFNIPEAEEYLKINNYIPITLSRGCPYNCRHCPTKEIYGSEWRGLHLNKVYDLLNAIKNATRDKNTMLSLTDNDLVYDLKWFAQVCQMFNQMDISWECHLRPDWVTEELAKYLALGRCEKVILSADVLYDYEPILANFLRKPITLDSLKKASAICHKAGMKVGIYFITDFYNHPEKVLPKIAEECSADLVLLSCLHDYDEHGNFTIISPSMKDSIEILKQKGIKVKICTGWGESSW